MTFEHDSACTRKKRRDTESIWTYYSPKIQRQMWLEYNYWSNRHSTATWKHDLWWLPYIATNILQTTAYFYKLRIILQTTD